jgi:hypothetical protein
MHFKRLYSADFVWMFINAKWHQVSLGVQFRFGVSIKVENSSQESSQAIFFMLNSRCVIAMLFHGIMGDSLFITRHLL